MKKTKFVSSIILLLFMVLGCEDNRYADDDSSSTNPSTGSGNTGYEQDDY